MLKRYYKADKDFLAAYRLKIKLRLMEYKGNKCFRCGYDKPVPSAYDFHHRNPKEKEFNLSGSKVANIQRIFKEVDKCDMVCRNCHAEIHDDPERRSNLLNAYTKRLEEFFLKEKTCPACSKRFQPQKRKQKFCTTHCGTINRRKVRLRPTNAEIDQMLRTMSWCAIGRQYGVSDNAVRKWRQTG